ncbi:MAG: hypothetical protein N3C60_05970 [Calditerrivibrio sp.]|nr:hypothetical protein [Calditerrivibrio sp.]
MLNTFQIYEELSQTFGETNAKVLTRTLSKVYEDLQNTVTKTEFNELKNIVSELAEAQKKTEERINELTEAQKRTEKRVDELAGAQKITEQRLNELAEAQKKTEESLQTLIKRVDKIEIRLEGISNSVGYSLENSAYKALPKLLKKYDIEVKDRLIRRYFGINEINIYGKGIQNNKSITILGECKVSPSKKEVDKFIKIANVIKKEHEITDDLFLIFVAHNFHPHVEKYLKDKGIIHFWSYEFE